MTRVSDDDLGELSLIYGDGSDDEDIRIAWVIAELLALRKVADAARRLVDADVDRELRPLHDMVAALVEAGR